MICGLDLSFQEARYTDQAAQCLALGRGGLPTISSSMRSPEYTVHLGIIFQAASQV